MLDNPKGFMIIIGAAVLSLTVIVGATRLYVKEVENNTTFTLSIVKPSVKTTSTNGTQSNSGSKGTVVKGSSAPNTITPGFVPDTTITYTTTGFSPNKITIRAGKSIRFINKTKSSMQVTTSASSNSTRGLEFFETTPAGYNGVYDVTMNNRGTFVYYNALKKIDSGIIVVE